MKYKKNFEEIEIDNEWNNMFKFTDKLVEKLH